MSEYAPGTILEDTAGDQWTVGKDLRLTSPAAGLPQLFTTVAQLYGPLEVVELTTPDFIVRDSGARQEFATGSQRDTDEGKPRYDLIPVAALRRLALHMAKGATKYGDNNWRLGQPMTRFEASMLRHAFDYMAGDRAEDHLSALLFNAMAIMDQEERIKAGKLPAELDDRPER